MQIFRELLTYMLQDPSTIEPALDLILVSRHLERIAHPVRRPRLEWRHRADKQPGGGRRERLEREAGSASEWQHTVTPAAGHG